MKYFRIVAIILAALSFASCSLKKNKVDLVLTHADFYTLDPRLPEAEAVAISNGRIVGVGTIDGIASRFEGKAVIDLRHAFVLPGLTDGHAHMSELGLSIMTLDLTAAKSPEEVVGLVEGAAARTAPGGWIRGGGWSPKIWQESGFSSPGVLDKAAPGDYVFLVSADGQAAWVNKRVIELAGVTKSTRDPDGGRILRSRDGEPTGVFMGSAINLIASKIPSPSESEIENAILLASDTCARYGITEVQDAGIDTRTLDVYQKLASEGKLKIRVYAMYDGNDSTLPAILRKGPVMDHGGYFEMRSVRVDMDGPLGPRAGALVAAYSDDPGNYGATLMGEKDLENLAIASLASGFQVCTEAHGDRANDVVLNAYEKAVKVAAANDPRLRIENVDVLLPEDISRFKELGIIPSMQPTECISDMYWVEARLGPDRIKYAYAWHSLLSSGSVIIGGSDFPAENPDPRLGIYAAVARRDLYGMPRTFEEAERYFTLTPGAVKDSSDFDGGFFPRQGMTFDEAIKAFTTWAAYGAFQESEKGSISVGKYADFTIFQKDLREVQAKEILSDPILGTIVGGKFVYVNPSAKDWRIP